MNKHKIDNEKNDPRECDECHRSVHYYIEEFRICLSFPEKKVVLNNDLLTSYICLKCLSETIKKMFIQDLKTNNPKIVIDN